MTRRVKTGPKRIQVQLSQELYDWLKRKQDQDEAETGMRPTMSAEVFAYVYLGYKRERESQNV
jgi:Holliday junction resolvasome RuvABC DNA-binding subunit